MIWRAPARKPAVQLGGRANEASASSSARMPFVKLASSWRRRGRGATPRAEHAAAQVAALGAWRCGGAVGAVGAIGAVPAAKGGPKGCGRWPALGRRRGDRERLPVASSSKTLPARKRARCPPPIMGGMGRGRRPTTMGGRCSWAKTAKDRLVGGGGRPGLGTGATVSRGRVGARLLSSKSGGGARAATSTTTMTTTGRGSGKISQMVASN